MAYDAQTLAFDRLGRAAAPALVDPFGREITYLRVSVTDRCDFRCVYCMSENMAFLPNADLLSLEELDRLCSAFITRGVRKLDSGGSPGPGDHDPCSPRFRAILRPARSTAHMTTTARNSEICCRTGPPRRRQRLARPSIPTFRAIALGELDKVGRNRRRPGGGPRVKINAVALKGVNEDGSRPAGMGAWRGMDLTSSK
jgi:cyclic pyranopterin phosphate synthase